MPWAFDLLELNKFCRPQGRIRNTRDGVTAKAVREAKRVVGIWNARHAASDLWFYPTIAAAIVEALRALIPSRKRFGIAFASAHTMR
jgi:hypothetical protein